ncbi:MAG: hypothetical protein LIP11_13995 [Clostridiales bacterium]|nr:hypothetical protein [Clostridiales bacterium]
MSDEIQLHNPAGLQLPGSLSFQQTGNDNTQIGYIEQQINNITMGGMPQVIRPANPNYEYYNLFVVDQEQMDSVMAIPRKCSLNGYTMEDVRKIYALPGLAAAEEIKRLPSLFVLRNQFGNHTTPGQYAGYGYVVDIRQKSDTIIVVASIFQVIQQEKLNLLEKELHLLSAPENNELDCVHWAIKRVNLPLLIKEKKLIDFMQVL